MNKKHRMHAGKIILAVIVICLVAGIIYFGVSTYKQNTTGQHTEKITPTLSTASTSIATTTTIPQKPLGVPSITKPIQLSSKTNFTMGSVKFGLLGVAEPDAHNVSSASILVYDSGKLIDTTAIQKGTYTTINLNRSYVDVYLNNTNYQNQSALIELFAPTQSELYSIADCTGMNETIYVNETLNCDGFRILLSNAIITATVVSASSDAFNYTAWIRPYYNNTLIRSALTSNGVEYLSDYYNNTYSIYPYTVNSIPLEFWKVINLTAGNKTVYLRATQVVSGYDNMSGWATFELSSSPLNTFGLAYNTSSAYSTPPYAAVYLPKGYKTYICSGIGPNYTSESWQEADRIWRWSSVGINSNSTCVMHPGPGEEAALVGVGVNATPIANYTTASTDPTSTSYYVSEPNSTVFIAIAGTAYFTYPGVDYSGVDFNLTTTPAANIYCTTQSATGTYSTNVGESQYGTGEYQYGEVSLIVCKAVGPYQLQLSYPYLYNSTVGIYNFKNPNR